MLLTINNVHKSWESPDGRVSIWTLTDQEGRQWQTRSQSIADSPGQTLELTTTVSKSGKTYLIRPPKEGYEPANQPAFAAAPAQAPQTAPPASGVMSDQALVRFEAAVSEFSDAVDRAAQLLAINPPHTHAPSGDVVLADLPAENPLDKLRGNYGEGPIVDDLS